MKSLATALAILALGALSSCDQEVQADPDAARQAVKFTAAGEMELPENLEEWVFLGSSLGMGYSDVAFNPDTPGNFQIVTMEPAAYAHFMETGKFRDGTMFALAFYSAEHETPPNESGFVMGDLRLTEIHLKDASRFPDEGFNFYMFEPDAKTASPLELPNDCVTCHVRDGAHDGVFTQFYPTIRARLAADAHRLEKLK